MPPAAPVLGGHMRKSVEIAAVRPAFTLGLRAATATIGPLVLAGATGQPRFGWMALGGWLCAIVDPGGPHLLRAKTMGAFAASAAAVAALGTLASTSPWLSAALLFAAAIASSLARVGGEPAGVVGNATLILLCIVIGTPAPAALALERVEMVVAGAALSAVLALVLWPVHLYRPARLALAACYRELATLARSIAEMGPDRERAWSDLVLRQPPRVRAALERARVALGAVRRGRSAETARGQQLMVLFETAEILLANVIAAGEALATAQQADAGWLLPVASAFSAVVDAVEDRADPPAIALPGPLPSAPGEVEHIRARLVMYTELALRVAAALRAGAPPEDEPAAREAQVPRTTLRAALAPDSALLRHAARLAITVSVATGIASALGLARPYWTTVAVVIVLQPDSGATLQRAVQRVLGTVLGAALAALLIPLLRTPILIGVVLFPLSALALALRPLNYGLFTMLITPVFLLMAEMLSGDWHLTSARVMNTLLGGALALAAQLLWPTRERDRLPQRLATLFHRLREYVDAVIADPRSEPDARRSFGLAAANADASFQRHLGEALEPAERISAYTALLTYARRLRNSLMMAHASPDGLDLRALRPTLDGALEELGAAAREQRAPRMLPQLDESTTAGARLSRQLAVLRSALERLAKDGEAQDRAAAQAKRQSRSSGGTG